MKIMSIGIMQETLMNNFIQLKQLLESLLQGKIFRFFKRRDKISKKSLKIKSLEITLTPTKILTIYWVKLLLKLNKNLKNKRGLFHL